ncbi:helix-turn-helix domain-containing protein [Prescottella agglutinans]|uniref:helix-turn-helix domain-containing protein n=1 Tax=Prescottella agglutinans TaxID=1644129 RepID=UPI0024767026|nr:hypothetical protein [Prescottella agglutinans]
MSLPEQLPNEPIAAYLADTKSAYRLLAFDFDAPRSRSSHGLVPPVADAVAFSSALRALGIPHLITASGSEWGRHVWIRLNDAVAPRTIRTLAELVKELHPTLDTSPLSNPRTGCVRIPGAAHRNGGVSEPIQTDDESRLEQLAAFSVGAHSTDLRRLRKHLQAQLRVLHTAGTAATPPRSERPKASPYETLAGPTIVGTRTAASGSRISAAADRNAALSAALAAPVDARDDHSRTAFSLLMRMAAAGWTRADALSTAVTAPGLEYLRTARCGSTARAARGDVAAFTIRQWGRATAKFAAWAHEQPHKVSAASAGARRAAAVQQAADASITPWAGHAGVHRRCVLDALCLLAFETRVVEFDIDQRRLALTAGVTQPTASRSLKWLREAGWITRISSNGGTKSDSYRLQVPQSSEPYESQGEPTPEQHGAPLHTALHHRLLHARHDLWTRDGLGSSCGSLHRAILAGHRSTSSLVQATGLSYSTVREHRDLLLSHGLITRAGEAVRRLAGAMLAAATEMGVAGVGEARRRLYTAQSLVWEWWHREIAWRTAPADAKPRRADHPVRVLRGRFPTRRDGRADFPTALGVILAGLPRAGAVTAA